MQKCNNICLFGEKRETLNNMDIFILFLYTLKPFIPKNIHESYCIIAADKP